MYPVIECSGFLLYKYTMNKDPYSSHEENLVPFLAALCIFLSAVEYAVPKPLPFMRLGLANLPIILALFLLNARQYFLLVFVKVLGQSIVSGTLFSYIVLFSAGGTFASSLAMFVMYRLFGKFVSCIGLSLLGALANNSVQLILARWILFGKGAFFLAPLLFITGAVTGVLLGLFALAFTSSSRWFALSRTRSVPLETDMHHLSADNVTGENTAKKKRRIKILPPLLVFISIVLFSLLQPYGRVLFSIFSFDITSGALISGLRKAFILTGMVVLSRLFIKTSFKLPGKPGLFMNRVFQYLGLLTQKHIKKGRLSSIIKAVDSRLMTVYFT